MLVSLITALTPGHVIGKNNQLPWHMPADLRHFKELTLGKPVIMGRKTFESIGKPLPLRKNIIITRNTNFEAPHCDIFHSLEDALLYLNNSREICIIGGAEIYQQAMRYATHLYLTYIDANIEGDAFFPQWDPSEWQEVSREDHTADSQNPHDYHFVILERK